MLDYDVVVLQQPRERGVAARRSARLQDAGIDRAVRDRRLRPGRAQEGRPRHTASTFGPERLQRYERCMRACDGVIVLDAMARRAATARFNPRVWVCRNGLDLGRYNLTRPRRARRRDRLGRRLRHREAPRRRGCSEVAAVMAQRPETRFVSVGQPFARRARCERFGAERCLSVRLRAARHLPGRDDDVRHRARARRQGATSTAARATCAGSRRARSASP